jgi:serine/threonine protein kinase
MTIADGSIKFEYQDDTLVLLLPNNDHFQWREVLRRYLNQRGFHQDFKPIKKIGKGNFASVYLAERNDNKLKCAVKAFSKEAAFSEENGK